MTLLSVFQAEAVVYQTVKDLLRQRLLAVGAGPWRSKWLADLFTKPVALTDLSS